MQCILNYRCPTSAETNEPLSVTFVYHQIRMASESPVKGPEHILLAFKDFRRVASLSSCFHSLFICLLTLTDLSNTPVLCPKCHVPVLG